MLQELNRTIVISEDIDAVIAKEVITQIMAINQYDQTLEDSMRNYQPEPIELVINSNGGSATDGFAIIGAMELSTTPIITYGFGSIASMALAIFLAGDVRISARHTRFMYHSVSYGIGGHITDHEEQLKEANILNKMYDEMMLENTSLTEEKLAEVRKFKTDFFLSANEAKELGFVHEVMNKPEKRIVLQEEESAEQSEQTIHIKEESVKEELFNLHGMDYGVDKN